MENLIFLQAELNKIIEGLISINLKQHVHSFEFNCSDLTDINPNQNPTFKTLISQLDKSLPTLYWFEIISDYPSGLKNEIENLRQGKKYKVPPTNGKNISNNILYVGKVRMDFRGRILQHLGYRSHSTWSLQLKHWTANLSPSLKLKLSYIQLNKETDNIILALLEQCLADKLKPILGKHSL